MQNTRLEMLGRALGRVLIVCACLVLPRRMEQPTNQPAQQSSQPANQPTSQRSKVAVLTELMENTWACLRRLHGSLRSEQKYNRREYFHNGGNRLVGWP